MPTKGTKPSNGEWWFFVADIDTIHYILIRKHKFGVIKVAYWLHILFKFSYVNSQKDLFRKKRRFSTRIFRIEWIIKSLYYSTCANFFTWKIVEFSNIHIFRALPLPLSYKQNKKTDQSLIFHGTFSRVSMFLRLL